MALAFAPSIVSISFQFFLLCSTEHNRKNWLFSDTPDGAHASMSVYTLIENAKAHKLKTYDYLKFVLKSRPNENMTDEELDTIVPWNEAAQAACGKIQE